MRISDWSSDVCSSDLRALQADAGERLQASELFHLYRRGEPGGAVGQVEGTAGGDSRRAGVSLQVVDIEPQAGEVEAAGEAQRQRVAEHLVDSEIGTASCRERVCQYVTISGVAGSLKKKKTN